MGGKNESQIKTQISNELSTEINNITRNINRVTNSSTTELIQSINTKADASVNVNTGGYNEIDVSDVIVEAGGTLDINQSIKLAVITNALVTILTDSSQLQNNITDLTDKIKTKVENDQKLKQDVNFLAKIGKYTETNGGPEAFLESLKDFTVTWIRTMTGSSNTNISETEVRNAIKTKINNEVINENEINNKISSSIKNSMEQLGTGSCKVDTTASNTTRVRNLLIGPGGKVNLNETLDISSFTSCIIELKLAANMASELTNKFVVDIDSDTSNNQGGDIIGIISGEIDSKDIQNSGFFDAFNNIVNNIGGFFGGLANSWMYIVGVIILIIAAVFLIPMMRSSKKSDDETAPNNDIAPNDDMNSDNGSNQRGGGINGNIYLLASLIAIFILIANKSLPLCGVLLIVIILYLVNKKKPEFLGLNN